MIIAIDFDGTCCTHEYPNLGRDIGAFPVLKQLTDAGHRLVLWTMRSGEHKQQALDWLHSHGVDIETDESLLIEQKSWTQSSKLYAHLYIDDAALGIPLIGNNTDGGRPFVDWWKLEKILAERGSIGNQFQEQESK